MLIKEHWRIENAHFGIFSCSLQIRIPRVIILNFCDRDSWSWKHPLNCSQYIVSDTNNFLNLI